MKVIEAGYEILDVMNGDAVLERIERVARTCYKSEGNIKDGSAAKMVKRLIRDGHEAMIEHYSFSVKFIVDRGISHEIVRHRIASFAQESTRYCNYTKDDFGNEITVIEPCYLIKDTPAYKAWKDCCQEAENTYFALLDAGLMPQEARAVLPTSLKTELVVTADLREWRNIFKLRCSKKAHPQIQEVMLPLLNEMHKKIPVVFDDIWDFYFEKAAYHGM